MESETKQYVTEKQTWLRGVYMLLFAVLYSIAEIVVVAVALFQFFALLLTGETNARLVKFGQDLSIYIYHVMQFVTFNREDKPFPFAPWPEHADLDQSFSTPADKTLTADTDKESDAASASNVNKE